MSDDSDHTASLMTPAKLAQLRMKSPKAVTPAAWLDQLAADAGSGHARRLTDLHKQLDGQQKERKYAPMTSALQALVEGMPQLDFALVQPKGWLARATGKGKEEAAAFAGQQARIATAIDDLRDELKELSRKQQAQTSAMERTLMEFDVEVKAIEKIIEQGTRWLADMRNQLKLRQSQSPDAAAQAQIDEDGKRCELLVARIKLLRAANSAAQHAREICATAAQRRANFLQSAQLAMDTECKAWSERLALVLAEAAESGSASQNALRGQQAHEELRAWAQQAATDCAKLVKQEKELAEELAVLAKPLEAAA
jgi:hypothetical protein